MSQQEQSTRMIEYNTALFLPSLFFTFFAFTITVILSYQVINTPLAISHFYMNLWILGDATIVFLALINMGYFYLQIQLLQYSVDDEYFARNANQFTGSRVQEFYHLLDKYILEDDFEVTQISAQIGKYRTYYFILWGTLIIIFLISSFFINLLSNFLLKIILYMTLLSIIGGIVGICHNKLNTLQSNRKIHCELAAMIFHNQIERIGLNLNSVPKTRYKRQLVDFLELTSFLQQFNTHFNKFLYRALGHGIVYLMVGFLLFNLPQIHILINLLGYCLIFGAIIYAAIQFVYYQSAKQIYRLSTETLGSYLILV